jgi:hypothetical protein
MGLAKRVMILSKESYFRIADHKNLRLQRVA